MRLAFLGTTGYHPNNRRHTACLMLPELGVVLDAGTGFFRVRDKLQTPTLDIFLTHAHLDHVIGLTFLFDVLWEKRLDHVRVHAQPDHAAAIREHLFSAALFPVSPPFEFVPLAPLSLPGGHRLTPFSLPHPGGSTGFRVDGPGYSLAYVTDTTAGPEASYQESIRGVDVLVHECYFPDGWEDRAALTGHSCTSAVATLARASQVGRLMLVHVNPLDESDDPIGLAAARRIFPETHIAEDGTELELG